MAAIINISGENKIITITDSNGDVTVTTKEIYSKWKEWVLSNPQWVLAFRTFGNDPLGSNLFAGDYYFLNNSSGWRIKPEEKNHTLTISGNLFGEDQNLPIFVSTIGNYNVAIRQGFSSLAQTVSSSSSITTQDKTDIISGVGVNLDTLKSDILTDSQSKYDVINNNIDMVKGLLKHNFKLSNITYDQNGKMLTSQIKIFRNTTDFDNNVNPHAIYDIDAIYDSSGKLKDYSVKNTYVDS